MGRKQGGNADACPLTSLKVLESSKHGFAADSELVSHALGFLCQSCGTIFLDRWSTFSREPGSPAERVKAGKKVGATSHTRMHDADALLGRLTGAAANKTKPNTNPIAARAGRWFLKLAAEHEAYVSSRTDELTYRTKYQQLKGKVNDIEDVHFRDHKQPEKKLIHAAGECRDTCKDNEDEATNTAAAPRKKVRRYGSSITACQADRGTSNSILYERLVDSKGKSFADDAPSLGKALEDPDTTMQNEASVGGIPLVGPDAPEPQISVSSPPKAQQHPSSPPLQPSSPSLGNSQPVTATDPAPGAIAGLVDVAQDSTATDGIVPGSDIAMLIDP